MTATSPAPEPDASTKGRTKIILFLTIFIAMLGLSVLFPIIGPLGRQLGLTPAQIGWFSTSYSLMQFIFSPIWGNRSEHHGRRPTLLMGLVGFSVSFGLFGLFAQLGMNGGLALGTLFALLVGTRIIGGIFSSATLPTAQAMMADISSEDDRAASMGLIGAALGLGVVFGPAIGGQPAREVPSRIYFDLATWHIVNTLYRPQRIAEVRAMKVNFANPVLHQRLLTVLTDHLGHDLLGRAERAKIEVADGGQASIDLRLVERGLQVTLEDAQAQAALRDDVARIVAAAHEAVQMAGLAPERIDALYFTGGSTGLRLLTDALSAGFPAARPVHGERLASVATGLGLYARRLWA